LLRQAFILDTRVGIDPNIQAFWDSAVLFVCENDARHVFVEANRVLFDPLAFLPLGSVP